MILYHGTNAEIMQIDLAQSRVGKDFGLGFYLTPDKNVAQRQVERKFVQYGDGAVRVYEYSIADSCFKELKVLQFDSYSLEWSQFILQNRKNRTHTQLHDYDVVGFQIRRIVEGIITEQQFLEEIKFHTVTIQYMFATQKAINMLQQL